MKRLLLIFWCVTLYSARDPEPKHVFEGNLALHESQQPIPLFCFGQEIIGKGTIQIFGYNDFLYGKRDQAIEVIPSVLYGVTDYCTVSAVIPVAAQLKAFGKSSSGIEDIWLQGEIAWLSKEKKRSVLQSTLIASLFLPTGSDSKNPPTGNGSPSVFLGMTLSNMTTSWNGFISAGGLFAHDNSGKGNGNRFFYQAGCGKNITAIPQRLIVAAMLEMYGTVSSGMSTKTIRGPSFEDNALYIGPSLWCSTPHWTVQAGIIFPVYQKKLPHHHKNYLFTAVSIGYTI
jgi:hypothetical protein